MISQPRPQTRETLSDAIASGQRVLRAEAAALVLVANRLDESFTAVAEALRDTRGRVAVSGVGKSADIGQKIVGTLNSTGTRAYLLDPMRALHGDLGMVHPDDTALVLSHSGEGDELLKVLGPLKFAASKLLAITSSRTSSLARVADAAIVYGPITEACPLTLAPSTSTTVMLALGDALAFVLSDARQFTPEDFARYHPAGSLGRRLATVETFMRRGPELRLAPANTTVREVYAQVRHTGRRTGAVMLTHPDGRLAGLFTDSDLARLFESQSYTCFDEPIATVMTANPVTVTRTLRMGEALDLMQERKFSEVPVVDEEGKPVGLLDITDLLGLPREVEALPVTLRLTPPTSEGEA